MHDVAAIEAFLAVAADVGGTGLSEAKHTRIADPSAVTVVSEDRDIVAVGVTAVHRQSEGSDHWEVETVVSPGLRFAEFERMVLESTLASLPAGVPRSVWSSRPSLDAALTAAGFHRVRVLARMVVDLPLEASGASVGAPGVTLRVFSPEDVDDVVRVNNAAFADHREASTLTEASFAELMRRPWFDAGGILIAQDRGGPVGFCWTKVHPAPGGGRGDGEIYRIAVDPEAQGAGLGRLLVHAGFEHLATRSDVARGMLWVDTANRAAMALYRNIGMHVEVRNAEWEPRP